MSNRKGKENQRLKERKSGAIEKNVLKDKFNKYITYDKLWLKESILFIYMI